MSSKWKRAKMSITYSRIVDFKFDCFNTPLKETDDQQRAVERERLALGREMYEKDRSCYEQDRRNRCENAERARAEQKQEREDRDPL